MGSRTNRFLTITLCAASAVAILLTPRSCAASSGQQSQSAGNSSAASRHIGAIKTIGGTAITLTPDSGPDVNIAVQPATRIVRIAPGEKDLKNATPIQVQDLQLGDRILVGGKPSDDNLSIAASTIVVMTHSDLEAKHQKDLQDWQKRGVGGIIKVVDAVAGTLTISVGGKDLAIRSSNTTMIRRYALDSWQFDDAKPSTLREIHPGDQVSARGDRSADGSELAAEEIISGLFPLFSATVNSIDASSSTVSVHDLSSKKTVLIKVTQDSLLRHLPPEMAQRFAAFLKGAAGGAMPSAGFASNGQAAGPGGPPRGTGAGGNGARGRSGGAPDFQRLVNRAPAASLADLHKGDAVIILSTEGTTSGAGTAIQLVSGVEPILQAAPNAAQAMMLTPWTMGAPSGDAGGP